MNIEKDDSLDVTKALDYAKKASGNKPKKEYNATKVDPHKRNGVSQVGTKKGSGIKNVKTNLNEAGHGDMVVCKDGVVGIVRERGRKLEDIKNKDEVFQLVLSVVDEEDTTFKGIDKYYNANDRDDEKEKYQTKIDENPYSEEALKLAEVKKAFAQWEIIPYDKSSGAVLAPKGDPRAIAYKKAMEDLQSGKFRLPTISEYEAQKEALKQKQNQKSVGVSKASKSESASPQQQPEQPKQSEVKPIDSNAPVNLNEIDPIKDYGKEDIEVMPNIDNVTREVMNSAVEDPIMAALSQLDNNKETKKEAQSERPPEKQAESVVSQATPAMPVTFNLAEAEAKAAGETAIEPEPAQNDNKSDDNTVTFQVSDKKAATFIGSMPPEMKEKVEAAKKINVIYAKDIVLPKTVHRLDIAGYRKVAPKNTSSEVVSAVLINSGYVGFFKAVGALRWSTISPILDDEGHTIQNPSPSKIAQFCHEQLVTTSIGNLSYRAFCEQTAATDIPSMLYAIMRASLPDEQEVTIVCPNDINHSFQSRYSISELPDFDDLPNETKAQIMTIMGNKDTIDDAKDVHGVSPVMTPLVYCAESSESKFIIKHFDIATSNDRNAVLPQLVDRYGESAAILAQCTKEVYVRVAHNGTDENPDDNDWSISSDPIVICEEYLRLNSSEMQDIMGITQNIPDFHIPTYSLKGTFVCPRCGSKLVNPRQPLQELVFQIALKARYLG